MSDWHWWLNPGIGFVVGLVVTYGLTKVIQAHKALKREEREQQAWHVVDTPVYDPDTKELLGWVSTRSDTGEFVGMWGKKKNLPTDQHPSWGWHPHESKGEDA